MPGHSWWKEATFYEVYVRSFQDTNGDGIGDLNGITARLDYLVDLGVDALWLTPFYPSPQVDFGYDISDYVDVDPQFGTLADFDRLVEAAHRRGLRIVTDLVPNHTSDQHPWFTESCSARDAPRRDWYIWRDPGSDGGPPNNWSSAFGPTAWTLDPRSGQYYYHFFYPEQPDLNWRNPAVEQAMFDVVEFWLERGVDGFRLDAIQTLFEDERLRDNPIRPEARDGSPTERVQEWLHTNHHPDTYALLERLRAFVDARRPECVLIGESAACLTFDQLLPYYGGDAPACHLPFNFFFTLVPELNAAAFRREVAIVEAALSDSQMTTYVLSNHDLPRAIDRYGRGKDRPRIAKLLAALLLTLRGVPFVYYGEEIGMPTTDPRRLEEVRDPVGRRYWPHNKGRDGERTPMQWSDAPGAGFSTSTPWLPIPSSATRRNVVAQRAELGSILNFYRAVLALRRASPALRYGTYEVVGNDPNVFMYVRRAPMQTVLVALNMSDAARPTHVPRSAQLLLSSVSRASSRDYLAPYEAAIWQIN